MVCGVAVVEVAISWKFMQDVRHFEVMETIPHYIPELWILACVILIGYYLCLRLKKNRITKYGDAPWEIEARKKEISRPTSSSHAAKEKVTEKEEVWQKDKEKTTSYEQLSKERKEEELNKLEMTEVRKIQEEGSSEEKWSDEDPGPKRSPLKFKL